MLDQEELETYFTVFEGSSPEDVSHARHFWSSQALLPPLESRLVSSDIRQRLPVSRPRGGSTAGLKLSALGSELSVPAFRQRQEERQRYEAMADQRKEILALLRRQREQRIQKELVSVDFKPKMKLGNEKQTKLQDASETEVDKELVKQLQ
ncbi:cilia- and flagella-associated protein HOATZ [Halichoeres trimaculatus]|uniref:cilia- and flagella-associated protein HOATZ n=1 Tax=Halichoeres trimaculatus TaxID=147232 RepID=UPI003D9EBB18